MDYARQIARMLHDEHVSTIAVLERLETLLRRNRKAPPDDPAADPEFCRTLRDLSALTNQDMSSHFAFEEAELFPRLAEFGDGAMGDLLAEEHRSLVATGARVSAAIPGVLAGDAEVSWQKFRQDAGDFGETMMSHIQKEEMGLLMALEAMLDEDTDRDLASAYSAAR